MEIDFQFVRDKVNQKLLHVRYISSKDPNAGLLTKSLIKARFLLLCDKLTVVSPPAQLAGV